MMTREMSMIVSSGHVYKKSFDLDFLILFTREMMMGPGGPGMKNKQLTPLLIGSVI